MLVHDGIGSFKITIRVVDLRNITQRNALWQTGIIIDGAPICTNIPAERITVILRFVSQRRRTKILRSFDRQIGEPLA